MAAMITSRAATAIAAMGSQLACAGAADAVWAWLAGAGEEAVAGAVAGGVPGAGAAKATTFSAAAAISRPSATLGVGK